MLIIIITQDNGMSIVQSSGANSGICSSVCLSICAVKRTAWLCLFRTQCTLVVANRCVSQVCISPYYNYLVSFLIVRLVKCCLCVNQDDASRTRCRDTCNLACTLMNPDRTPKTRSIWPTLHVKIARRKKTGAWIGIFKPAEPHIPWDAYYYYYLQVY